MKSKKQDEFMKKKTKTSNILPGGISSAKSRPIYIKQLKSPDIPFIREKILRKQKGICPICEKKVERACLDHHHKKRIKGTGRVRGVLCSGCNVFLGKQENNSVRYGIKNADLPRILRNSATYFEKKQYPYIHPSEAPSIKFLKKTIINKLIKAFKEKYPNKKVPEVALYKKYTKGKKKGQEKKKKLTVGLERLLKEFNINPEFLKGK